VQTEMLSNLRFYKCFATVATFYKQISEPFKPKRMTPKKNPEADLEKGKAIHIEVGLVIILSITLVCFEWSTPETNLKIDYAGLQMVIEPDVIIERTPAQEKKKEPEKPALQPIIDIIEDPDPNEIYGEVIMQEGPGTGLPDWLWKPQDEEEKIDVAPIPVDAISDKPVFPGGNDKLLPWIYSHIKYPDEAAENGVGGVVTATFVVNQKGKVVDVKILKGVHPSVDNEVLRVLGLLPDFKPAIYQGRYISVLYSIPVRFTIQ